MNTQQQQAQTLFFRSDLNQEEIADIVGINRKTLYTWIRKFGWTRTRTEDELTRDRVISQTLSLMERINLKTATKNNWNYNPEDIKALSKLAGIIKTLKSTKLANEDSKALKGFMKFVAENNPDAQEVIKSSIDKYLQSKSGAATESYAEFSPNLVLEKDKYYDEVLETQDNEPEEVIQEEVTPPKLSETKSQKDEDAEYYDGIMTRFLDGLILERDFAELQEKRRLEKEQGILSPQNETNING